jgi:Ca2+-binding EF-hand superfamily protein
MKTLFLTVAFGAAAIAAPSVAQAPEGGFNRDQTRAEAQQRADKMFQMFDTNRDGTVTRAEAAQAVAQFEAASGGQGGRAGRMERMVGSLFSANASLTLQQFEANALARFDAADVNHDGTVTAAERQQARAEKAPAKAQ